MWKLINLVVLILLVPTVSAYDNIMQFDMNEDLIITTTVYNGTGQVCQTCNCSLYVYNPAPDSSTLNLTVNMTEQATGVFSTNLTNSLTYNKNIYPIVLTCSDVDGWTGGDERVGIKVGESLFDYTSVMLSLIIVAAILMFASFKIDKSLYEFRLVTFLGSFPFMIGAIILGYMIVDLSPKAADFKLILGTMFTSIMFIFLFVVYFFIKQRYQQTLEEGKKML